MAAVSVGARELTVKFRGIHKFWTLRRRLEVPLEHVVDARMDPALAASSPGWRLLGADLPGVAVAGRFISNGERAFWDLRNPTNAVVIELRGERYKRLVLEVDDPETVVEAIHRALPAATLRCDGSPSRTKTIAR